MTAETANQPDTGIEVGPEADEMDEIDQLPLGPLTLCGVECQVARLRTREVFRLLRILTRAGLTGGLMDAIVSGQYDEEELAGRMVGALMVALPESEADTLQFLRDIVIIPDDVDTSKREEIIAELRNPDLETSMLIIQYIVDQEAGELVRLGKAAKNWWSVEGPRIKAKAKSSGT